MKKKKTNKSSHNHSNSKASKKYNKQSLKNKFHLSSPEEIQKSICDCLDRHGNKGVSHARLLNQIGANVKKDKRMANEQLNVLIKNKDIIYKDGKLRLENKSSEQTFKVNDTNATSKKKEPTKTDTKGKFFIGTVDINRRGTGFIQVDGLVEDIRVSPSDLSTAFKGDTVKVVLKASKGGSKRSGGKVVEIVKRKRTRFVGKVQKIGDQQWLIESDEKSAHVDFFVNADALFGAKHNDKVLFDLLAWHNNKGLPQAKVVEVLGPDGSRDAIMLSILGEAQYRAGFPDEVQAYVKEIDLEIKEKEVKRRIDLRDELIFTIDPVDAKDFDDALSIQILENGNYYLGVHIADVTHFVEINSTLDKEALERATSVYLVDRVIPMLPEALSNYACSLRPGEDKYAYSCFMEITPRGKLVDYKIAETVIHSKRRFSYEEAQEVLDGKFEDACEPALKQLAKLAETLLKKRMREGSVKFETPEPRFVLDSEGKPIEVKVKERLFAHKLIEECMLMANKTVALYIDALRKKVKPKTNTKDHFPFFYRVHDKPDPKKLAVMSEYIKPLGIVFDPDEQHANAKALNEVLAQVEGKPIEQAVNDLMVRSMAKAEYKPENIGHFGLGFSHYAHFTSPIRRYPDVIVHRLLKAYHNQQKTPYHFNALQDLGVHTSNQEKQATIAERESIKLKQVEYMSERIGQEFTGVISGLNDRGIFVLMKDVYCEGMVSLADLNDDYYVYHQHLQRLVGNNKGRIFTIGQEIQVRVENTNLERRTIDLSFVKA